MYSSILVAGSGCGSGGGGGSRMVSLSPGALTKVPRTGRN